MSCKQINHFGFCGECLADEDTAASSPSYGNFFAWLLRGATDPEKAFSARPAVDVLMPALLWLVALAIRAFLRLPPAEGQALSPAEVLAAIAPKPQPSATPSLPVPGRATTSQRVPPPPSRKLGPNAPGPAAPGRLGRNNVRPAQPGAAGTLGPNMVSKPAASLEPPASEEQLADAAEPIDLLAGARAAAPAGMRLGPNTVSRRAPQANTVHPAPPPILRDADGKPDPGEPIPQRGPMAAVKSLVGNLLGGG